MTYNQKEYHRHQDEAILLRDQEDAIARLRTALFVALLGPLAIGAIYVFEFSVLSWIRWGILATAPLGFVLGIVAWMRIPGAAKTNGRTIRLLLFTLTAAVSTIPLAYKFIPQ